MTLSLQNAAKSNTKLTDFNETRQTIINYRSAVKIIPRFGRRMGMNQNLYYFMDE